MNKKITLSIALMLMASSQAYAATTSLLSADSAGASITMPDPTISPDMANIANRYIAAMPTSSNSQFTQQMPSSSMAFTATGPTISPTSSLADAAINTSALYENMAMAQNVGATNNTEFNMMSGNNYDAMSTVDSSTMTDSSTNTYTNSANTATNDGSGYAANERESIV